MFLYILSKDKSYSLLYSGTPFESSPWREATPLERPLDYVNLNINVLISTPDEKSPLL